MSAILVVGSATGHVEALRLGLDAELVEVPVWGTYLRDTVALPYLKATGSSCPVT